MGNEYFNSDGYTGYSNLRGQGAGIYTTETQFNFDTNILYRLGFDNSLIQTLNHLVAVYGKITPAKLQQYANIPYETAKDIKYMYDIATGRIVVDSEQDLIKHLRRVFGKDRRIGISDLALSKIKDVPRMAVVSGIKVEPYTIYNSQSYPPQERLYKVVSVASKSITVVTKRKPKLKYGTPKKIDGVLEIKSNNSKGEVEIAFNKKVSRLCNRFIIVGSLRKPEFHLGLVEILCIEGTKVYVYAQLLKANSSIRYNYGAQRVYDYGYLKNEINPKLMSVASWLYPMVAGIQGTVHKANLDYVTVADDKVDEEAEFDE